MNYIEYINNKQENLIFELNNFIRNYVFMVNWLIYFNYMKITSMICYVYSQYQIIIW